MIKRFIWAAVASFVVIAAIIGVKKFYFSLTDGFSLANIYSDHPYRQKWAVKALNPDEMAEFEQAIGQPYHYLGKGHQAYVFESDDGSYVIKFLKFQKYRIHPLAAWVPAPAFIEAKLAKKRAHKLDKRDALFNSWKIAFEDLKDQTAVINIHINLSDNLKRTLRIYNKAGWAYDINLDDYTFLIQRKTGMLADAIQNLVKNDQADEANILLDNLLALYLYEYNRGLLEKDRYIVRNTGVWEGRPIHIDLGRFMRDESLKNPEAQAKELIWKTKLLRKWLEKNYPELEESFQESLNKKLNADQRL